MNHKKIMLVGFISAFVAILTSVLGVAGTIIGSVVSSVLYNMLTEALEKPVNEAAFSTNFEWEIAYIFPLAVIALIQLLLIFALLSQWGILPQTFLNAFLSLQNLANNNLYRILGIAMLVISIYPFVIKPDFIKKSHGLIIAFVGLIFLARGFVDAGNIITNLYDEVFILFDFPIAVIALILIVYVIFKILLSAKESEKEFRIIKHQKNSQNFSNENIHKTHHSKKHEDFDFTHKRKSIHVNNKEPVNKTNNPHQVKFDKHVEENPQKGINKSSANIQFESNDLLDDYKK
ncbi:hypothetical protein [Methanobrevibacter sp.]